MKSFFFFPPKELAFQLGPGPWHLVILEAFGETDVEPEFEGVTHRVRSGLLRISEREVDILHPLPIITRLAGGDSPPGGGGA